MKFSSQLMAGDQKQKVHSEALVKTRPRSLAGPKKCYIRNLKFLLGFILTSLDLLLPPPSSLMGVPTFYQMQKGLGEDPPPLFGHGLIIMVMGLEISLLPHVKISPPDTKFQCAKNLMSFTYRLELQRKHQIHYAYYVSSLNSNES